MKRTSHKLDYKGAAVVIFIDKSGYLTIDLDTTGIDRQFVHEGIHNIPKVRFILNEEDRRTKADGEWENTP